MAQLKDGAVAAKDGGERKGSNPLLICRNKHWKYISCYHGSWFQLPPELLQMLAHENYTMPQPRLIDPGVFFDMVKIRRAIDEAMEETMRASSGLSNGGNISRFDPFGVGQQPAVNMSKERIHRVRQKAVKLLAKSYELDEVATSVVIMSSSSSLEDVAHFVLRRDMDDADAKYVHFFHEKIPSRLMDEHTSLGPLNEILRDRVFETQAAPMRTRGLVKIMKNDSEGAINDFTYALRIVQELNRRHGSGKDELVLTKDFAQAREQWERNPKSIPQLRDDEQPTSLEQQLLFNRAGVYLSLAVGSVHEALDGLGAYLEKVKVDAQSDIREAPSVKDQQQQVRRLQARKRVKSYAKRACKDYMAFLHFLDYTPGFPVDVIQEMMQRVYDIASGPKYRSQFDSGAKSALTSIRKDALAVRGALETPNSPDPLKIRPPEIYPASHLFAAQPLSNLPVFPTPKSNSIPGPLASITGVRETVTYHPLLPEALHSLLLTHCLLQTSSTELLRHAHSAARLARIADGYPIFQTPRSASRADWIAVLRKCNNWIGLPVHWGEMCHPSPLSSDAAPGKTEEETVEQRRERIRKQAISEALGDERVVDEDTFQRNVAARKVKAERDEARDKEIFGGEGRGKVTGADALMEGDDEEDAGFMAGEYPVTTERVEAICRWIKEAPAVMPGQEGGKKKKKRSTRKKEEVVEGMGGLSVGDGGEVDNGHPFGNGEVDEEEDGPD